MPRIDAEILPPRGTREFDSTGELDRIERFTNLLDAWIEIPGTSIRVGLDPIVGLIPGFGDALTFFASLMSSSDFRAWNCRQLHEHGCSETC